MLAEVLKLLEERLALIRGTVMLLSPDGSELIIAAAPGIPGPTQGQYRYRYGEGIIGKVVQTGQPAIVPQVFEEPDLPIGFISGSRKPMRTWHFFACPSSWAARSWEPYRSMWPWTTPNSSRSDAASWKSSPA